MVYCDQSLPYKCIKYEYTKVSKWNPSVSVCMCIYVCVYGYSCKSKCACTPLNECGGQKLAFGFIP